MKYHNRMREKILVHCCCGPCATSSLKRLIDEGYEPVLCYGNLLKVASYFGGLEVIRQDYDHQAWLDFVKGLENEPEGGARCQKCFEFNLRAACEEARRLGIGCFTTTLTVSRFKNSANIFKVGSAFEGFEPIDFKKKDGFARSCQIARELGLYRQQYCGCEFSIAERVEEDA